MGIQQPKTIRIVIITAISLALSACASINKRERDVDRTPVVDTGAGATILMPGQAAPAYQGPIHPRENQGAGSFGQPPTSSSAEGNSQQASGPAGQRTRTSGTPAPRGSSITMIGGNTTEEERHQRVSEEPLWLKYVVLPFAIIAAPFYAVAEAVGDEPTDGAEVPSLENAPPPAPAPPAQTDYETARLESMERELAQRQATSPPRSPEPVGADISFADELAALASAPKPAPKPPTGRAPTAPTPPSPSPRAPQAPGPSAELMAASGQVDRNADGRVDQWIFRQNGDIAKERFDDDFDGLPDKTLLYDLATHQVAQIDEDLDFDGRVDSWTTLRDGQVLRKRADNDGDGHVDSWGFFRDGALARLDRDSSGDGFRDQSAHYAGGQLLREERDANADGQADTILHYDSEQQIAKREEDTNQDGLIDMVSHYEQGKLKRRELLEADLAIPAPRMQN